MNWWKLTALSIAVFCLGWIAPAAFAGVAHSSWLKIDPNLDTGNCAFVRATVDSDATEGRGTTENRARCTRSSNFDNVPAGFIGVSASLINVNTNYLCGGGSEIYNQSSAHSITAHANLHVGTGCGANGTYHTFTSGDRWKPSDNVYIGDSGYSPNLNF